MEFILKTDFREGRYILCIRKLSYYGELKMHKGRIEYRMRLSPQLLKFSLGSEPRPGKAQPAGLKYQSPSC